MYSMDYPLPLVYRFPDAELLSAFGCLGMRPISLMAGKELEEWGVADLNILVGHFGEEKTTVWMERSEDDKQVQKTNTSPPIINRDDCLKEWKEIKTTVIAQGYPRDKFVTLWQLISKFHRASFPNLIKLAEIALVLPVHTADVERGFSAQNIILTAKRNRLLVATQNMLLKQKVEGTKIRDDNFVYDIVCRW